MTSLIAALDAILRVLRVGFFWFAALLAVVCLVDWAVRTRRLSPFGGVARFFRSSVDPLLLPIERRVLRAGGMPSTAPWWALAAVVLGGILVISLLDFLRDQLTGAAAAAELGGRGVVRLVVSWAFGLLNVALLVRVITSWLRVSPYSPWVRWAYVLTEPILRPLRRIIPMIGMIDITPIVAYFLLQIVASFLLQLV